jgi:hypothetical protein
VNRGHRAAKNITVDLICPAAITAWEMTPTRSDVAAAWECTHDPLPDGGDAQHLRLEQSQLRPQARCRLLIGYNDVPGMPLPLVRAYSQDRRLRFKGRERPWDVTLSSIVALVVGFALLRGVAGIHVPSRGRTFVEALGALLVMLCVAAGYLAYILSLRLLEFFFPEP